MNSKLKMTRQQRIALFKVYQRNSNGSNTFRAFMARAVQGYDCIMINWCGMWLGIESSGYTHS